jgi:DNA-binding CsgD family transcriptional regulator/predicted negative regulator of RcsB-dependent stress response
MKIAQDCIASGQAALAAGDWQRARDSFERALEEEESAEGHDGLGQALWWLNRIEEAHRHRSRAYLEYKKRGDLPRAAGIAAWLAREQVFLHANASAMKGWFSRAERLLGEAGPCVQVGWLLVLRASMLASPSELERTSQEAVRIALEYKDTDLEAFAMAFCGLARVSLGRIEEGMGSLDEAMAIATGGEVAGFMAISEIFCVTLSACELAGDLVRTEHWCRAAADYARVHNCGFLSAYCRTTYGGLLINSGKWRDAESELLQAINTFGEGHRALRVHAVLKLADLRVCQGRLEEAQALLSGYEDQGGAVLPLARLCLARGEAEMARATLEQALRAESSTSLYRAPLLLLLVEVLMALGDMAGAHEASRQLGELARTAQSALLLAQADLAEGQVRRSLGEPGAADSFQSALDRLSAYEQSLLSSRARLEMARLLRMTDHAGAVTWARAALASFQRLGASHDADEAAKLLRELGAATRTNARAPSNGSALKLTPREEEVLGLVARGMSNREIAERMFISPKTAEHHISRVLSKLGARSRAEAVAFALKRGGPDIE